MPRLDGPVQALARGDAERLLAESANKPHEGRVYDYYLGGTSNYAADRLFAQRQIATLPDLPWAARQNRGFVGRAVRHLIARGIRQFIDLGSGFLVDGTVHQVAERYAPGECRVVYVDHDPLVSDRTYRLLQQSGQLERNRSVNGDLLRHEELWEAVLGSRLINPRRPVGLLMTAVLHFVPDEANPHPSVAFFRDQVIAGSGLAISHVTTDGMSAQARAKLEAVAKDYDQTTSRMITRHRDELLAFFGDWSLVQPPGLVWTPEWTTPESGAVVVPEDPSRAQGVAGLAWKP
ncbi:SAM-dependent methyltransferase [Amycolatopsis cynarae]|uniref:SAM-dependent methyltransferase n=1 Tax=Amycolatopsis cynarae TaxID=2995223 RepID=A0ABY7B0W2_9PSEU|nr:SAM-dependent methyltransferase [Amycolatopsis sp. HUAS 11-8]WAL65925.1 SAM-dependent methyltransferase [Amycolatopsis sp. HUAS 11-8]